MYSRILVGTDGSTTAAKAVARAVDVAATTGASLTILSAGSPGDARRHVDDAAAAHASSGVAIDTRIVESDPVSAIMTVVDEGSYDLVVVGNKGMTGVRRFLPIGSVPNKLSHHLRSNLLIVRTT